MNHLEFEHESALENLEFVESRLQELDSSIVSATSFADGTAAQASRSWQSATEAVERLRDRETLLQRLAPLRAQYTEDIRKLTMLVEAHGLFDPLTVLACPGVFLRPDRFPCGRRSRVARFAGRSCQPRVRWILGGRPAESWRKVSTMRRRADQRVLARHPVLVRSFDLTFARQGHG